MLSPNRAVFVGGAVLEPAIAYCRARGFAGPIEVVNPTRTEIAGIRSRPAIEALDHSPDVAFLAVPKEAVVETVAALAARGTAGTVCNASGFSESDPDGAARQAALAAAAGEMPLLGPNAPGFANFLDRAAFMMGHFGDHAPERGLAAISNGGAYLSDIGCADRSVPLAYAIGLGNQAMITVADMLDAVLDDPRVTAVNLYFEGLLDVPTLSRAALKAACRDLPVVVVKGGRSASGTRAARSHTAALAGDAELASALFARFGWIEVASPSEALETVKMLTCTERPRGNRTGLATSSGSYAVLGADLAEEAGLVLPPPGRSAARALRECLPNFVGPANPLDVSTAHDDDVDRQRRTFDAFLSDDFDLAVQVMCYPPLGGWERSGWDKGTEAFNASAAARGLPRAFVNTLPELLHAEVRERMIAGGMAPLQGLEEGLRAIGHAVRYGTRMAKGTATEAAEILLPALGTLSGRLVRHDEAAAKAHLAAAGLSVPRRRVLAPGDPVEGLDFPVALKALSGALAHKTEAGAVALGLASPAAVAEAMDCMQARLRSEGLAIERFLVEEMVRGTIAELLVGVRRAPGIGLALTLAGGGRAVELLRDSATVVLPAGRGRIEAALRSLRLFPLLEGWRGQPGVDLSATLDAIEALRDFAEARRDRLEELEINPLVLNADGAIAVDAVLVEAGDPSSGGIR